MKKKVSQIYLDYASLTPVDERVERVMVNYMKKEREGVYANPSSVYGAGARAKKLLLQARAASAGFFRVHSDEIFFTGSGTESNNLSLLGTVNHLLSIGRTYKDMHIIVSAIEHASVLETAHSLRNKGVRVDIIPVNEKGIVDVTSIKKLISEKTVLVSIMMVNNEIGTIQPLHNIIKIVRNFRTAHSTSYPLIHTDACQALLYMDINLEKIGVDLLSADSHKIYGPRGIGMLYVRRSSQSSISSIMFGGDQEDGIRPGTENMPGIIGFAKALEIAGLDKETETIRITKLRDYAIKKIISTIPNAVIYGDQEHRIANNINVSFKDIDHEFLLLELDVRGIMCSTKSSCLRDEDESYVIKAIGGKTQSLRFSLGRLTTKKDLDFLIQSIDECIHL